MCVLYGWTGKITSSELATLLALGESKARHSTGLTDGIRIIKEPISPFDFVSNQFDDVSDMAASTVGIAHARFATVGVVNFENAHPFRHKDLVFAHNGTVTNHTNFGNFRVDSLCLGPLIEAEELGKIEGTAGICWIKGGKLYVYRSRKPLYAAITTRRTVVCTYEWILKDVFSRAKVVPIPENCICEITRSSVRMVGRVARKYEFRERGSCERGTIRQVFVPVRKPAGCHAAQTALRAKRRELHLQEVLEKRGLAQAKS